MKERNWLLNGRKKVDVGKEKVLAAAIYFNGGGNGGRKMAAD